MNRLTIILALIITGMSYSCDAQKLGKFKVPTIPGATGTTALTETEIINGLKEALTKGAQTASQTLNRVDGYNGDPLVRIPFPEEIKQVESSLRNIGMGKQVDEFVVLLNRSAEDAAKEAAPIFVDAVKNMSFADAKSILTGPDTAATAYLRKSTYASLYSLFSPHIKSAMDSHAVTSKWTTLANAYNKLPTTRTKVNPDLVAYVTHKALKGLFQKVADEEIKIRKDPMARTSDLLKKVFGSQQK